ncbi:hypothetical protein KFZ58_05805 [Virgibacillus sp. NKC19-16]|uniref:hypothetical protein n=1 Tax=Virgibacillus salidurans TaxID=2831673 RepID=UPI001F21A5ED|nr:hypothetical protein [Virgibacillus sp. NKC19-16]UJL47400.1 hypothetical protein KFZ58_05805 [Virgibacillus sp. NKC19-16]
MVETMIDFMLGPFTAISDFYFEYQIIFNTLIVGFALYKIIFNKKKNKDESVS